MVHCQVSKYLYGLIQDKDKIFQTGEPKEPIMDSAIGNFIHPDNRINAAVNAMHTVTCTIKSYLGNILH
jgi:hypothetical protein